MPILITFPAPVSSIWLPGDYLETADSALADKIQTRILMMRRNQISGDVYITDSEGKDRLFSVDCSSRWFARFAPDAAFSALELEFCYHCQAIVHGPSAEHSQAGETVCNTCWEEDYDECTECEETYHENDLRSVYRERGGYRLICEHCCNTNLEAGWYHYDNDGDLCDYPEPVKIHKFGYHEIRNINRHFNIPWPKTVHRFGIEAEVMGDAYDSESARIVQDAMTERFIYTHDSTVDGEFVSACLTMGQLSDAAIRLADVANGNGFRGDDGTGNHLHCDKRMLTAREWHDLANYCQDHSMYLERIAECSNGYADWTVLPTADADRFVEQYNGGFSGDNRCVGLNLTKHTVEFRCLRFGTAKQVAANIMLVRALVALARLPQSHRPQGSDLWDWLCSLPPIRRWVDSETTYRYMEEPTFSYAYAWRDANAPRYV